MYSLVIKWTLFTNVHDSYITTAYINAVEHSKMDLKTPPPPRMVDDVHVRVLCPGYIHT